MKKTEENVILAHTHSENQNENTTETGNVLLVNFNTREVTKAVTTRKEVLQHLVDNDKKISRFLTRVKNQLPLAKYVLVLEAILCASRATALEHTPYLMNIVQSYFGIF